jgi:hypothetical protein
MSAQSELQAEARRAGLKVAPSTASKWARVLAQRGVVRIERLPAGQVGGRPSRLVILVGDERFLQELRRGPTTTYLVDGRCVVRCGLSDQFLRGDRTDPARCGRGRGTS